MKYFEVIFEINPWNEDAADLLAALCGGCGFETFVNEEPKVKGYIQQEFLQEEELAATLEFFPMPEVKINYEVHEAEDKNWNEEWEKNGFQPIKVGQELVVRGVNHEMDEKVPFEILLDPKMAFGTGGHQTTHMILEQLLHMDLEGKEVLDAGCGTGVLGIMAALKGAKQVFAYDIDEWSVRNTETNCQLNQVSNLTAVEGDSRVLEGKGPFDLVLANINRNILLADMKQFVSVIKPQGTLILSGFYHEDVKMLQEAAENLGMTLEREVRKEEWSCLVFTR